MIQEGGGRGRIVNAVDEVVTVGPMDIYCNTCADGVCEDRSFIRLMMAQLGGGAVAHPSVPHRRRLEPSQSMLL